MDIVVNLLKAIGIVIAALFLLFAGLQWIAPIVANFIFRVAGRERFVISGGVRMAYSPRGFVFLALLVLLAFGALYLPPQGRLYAALAALLFILAIWVRMVFIMVRDLFA